MSWNGPGICCFWRSRRRSWWVERMNPEEAHLLATLRLSTAEWLARGKVGGGAFAPRKIVSSLYQASLTRARCSVAVRERLQEEA